MNDLITMLQGTADKTPAQAEAIRLDNDLRVHKGMIETGIVGMAYDLKEMRDRGLYRELGYDSFDAYTEQEHGIKSRQAYKYIHAYEQLGEDFLHSSAKLGITKLDLLASLSDDERAEVLSEHTVEELDVKSTAEYRALLEKYENTVEQLTFLDAENKVKAAKITVTAENIEKKVAERLQAEMDNIRREAEESARKAAKEEQQAKLDELKKKAKDAADKAKAAAEEKKAALAEAETARKEKLEAEEAKKAAEDAAAQSLELSAKLKAEQERAATMEKQIKMSADPELTRFKFMFDSWQKCTQDMADQFKKLPEDMRAKMRPAFGRVMEVNGL